MRGCVQKRRVDIQDRVTQLLATRLAVAEQGLVVQLVDRERDVLGAVLRGSVAAVPVKYAAQSGVGVIGETHHQRLGVLLIDAETLHSACADANECIASDRGNRNFRIMEEKQIELKFAIF
jgi:hypothetical protein